MFRAFPTFIALFGVLVCQMTSLGHQHDEVPGKHAAQPHFHWQIAADADHHHGDTYGNHSHQDESDPLSTPAPTDGHDSDAVYIVPGNANYCLCSGTALHNLSIEISALDQLPIEFGQLVSSECRHWTDSISLCIFDCPAYLRLQNFRI